MIQNDDVVITGIGLVSSLGEGNDAHWQRLSAAHPRPVLDETRFQPYTVHPLPPIDWNLQIAKRGDQRQMETWQRLGTYAAGLALDDAGVKNDDALCASMDMVVAAAGGERDEEVDARILQASESRDDRGVLLNERLTTELRPTLFLAQLSKLLAGNISIVHKVTGSSRTFMGEEGAGVSAVETAAARIASGQSTHMLVGGAFQTEHHDMLIGYELAGFLHRGPWRPVWQRRGSPAAAWSAARAPHSWCWKPVPMPRTGRDPLMRNSSAWCRAASGEAGVALPAGSPRCFGTSPGTGCVRRACSPYPELPARMKRPPPRRRRSTVSI